MELENGFATTSEDKANAFNEHFAKQSQLDDGGKVPDASEIEEVESSLENVHIPYLNVKKILDNLNITKASGGDEISPRVLKHTATTIAPTLARIFNFCFQSGKFPKLWKLANVSPLYKNKGKKSEIKNYRPVSLLSCVGKVMERCIFDAMFKYLKENKLLSKYQAAYLPGSSTETQVLEMYHKIIDALDKGKDIRFIFLDVSKAFDRVWHRGLIAKLKRYGISGKLITWLIDYLVERRQRVVVEGASSDYKDINAGVPQGSILGPLLFLLYVNDLPTNMASNVRIYADDTSLFIDYKKADEGKNILQGDIQKIENWADKWLMEFNPGKTESLVFTRKRVKKAPTMKMRGNKIKEVHTHKHLGLNLQQNGKWTTHIAEIVAKSKKKVDILRGLMYKINRKSIERLYLSFIRPVLEYGSTIWDNCTDREKKSLEEVQLAALRAITGAKRGTSHELLYGDTGIEPLQERRNRRKITQMYKIHSKDSPQILKDILPNTTKERTARALRTDSNTTLIKWNTISLNSSFLPSTIKKWNALPEYIRKAGSVEQFKEYITPPKDAVPEYLYYGERKAQVLHTRLRLRCSDLNEELHRINLAESPLCSCGDAIEDAEHFLQDCRQYTEIRNKLETNLQHYDIEELLMGNPLRSLKQNEKMFKAVHRLILESGRFR